jgi:hypothetical protein
LAWCTHVEIARAEKNVNDIVDHFSQQMRLAGPNIVYVCGHLKEPAEVSSVIVFNLTYLLAVRRLQMDSSVIGLGNQRVKRVFTHQAQTPQPVSMAQ